MRKIIYRGAEQIFRIITSTKAVYVFEKDNGFSVTPSTWADYYDIISYDSTHKTLVDAKDDLARTDMRRKSQFDYEVPVEIYEAQVERDVKAKNDKYYQSLIQEYKRGVYDQIASGVIESIPEDIEEMAIAYADKKTAPKEEEVFPIVPEEIVPPVEDEVPPPTLPTEVPSEPPVDADGNLTPTPTEDETPADEGETSPSDPKIPEEIPPTLPVVETPKVKDSKK